MPRWLRPRAAPILQNRAGQLALTTASELIRVQIFDRAMTLAAQAFTSIFPILIMLGAFFGHRARDKLDDLLKLPDSAVRVVDEALSDSGSSAFGLLGSLIVVLSATGLARALNRAYRVIWSSPGRPAGPAATAWQIGTVILLVLFLITARVLGWLSGLLPAPRVAGVFLALAADFALAFLLPRILLGPLPRLRLLFSGALFALVMVGVRAAGSIYLPRAIQTSAERYGTIGLAFTFIGWLYVISFVLLLTAVVGGLLADLWSERPPRLRRTAPRVDAPPG
ncbi:YihY/virulence factor BrkB family protein [Actinoplanes sp. NEAU-A11]|uniref:YihY/virulence factor BrkB family protein n=2 Tax=Actinoplanes aureus TaxID=2792083 RepID=A0A931G1L9_9ACTN|nr:YihY/virulence factor BrkB family protein [Actinoplanes aureus]